MKLITIVQTGHTLTTPWILEISSDKSDLLIRSGNCRMKKIYPENIKEAKDYKVQLPVIWFQNSAANNKFYNSKGSGTTE